MDTLYCYQVEVKTTNSARNTTKSFGRYLPCEDGIIFVTAEKFEDIATVVESDVIKSVILMGRAYVAGEDK